MLQKNKLYARKQSFQIILVKAKVMYLYFSHY